MTPPEASGSPAGADVDLDHDDIRLSDGTRLTAERAGELAEWALGRHPGRPSVTGDREETPRLSVRVPRSTRAALEQIAAAQGRRLADVGRDALDEYIRRHAS